MTVDDPSDPKSILRDLEQHARKRFGQHFLARPDVVSRIVRAARVVPGDKVVEIGPGLGILTQALIEAGADVTAIEIDDDLAERITRVYPQVQLVHADATRADWATLCPGEGYKLVANLPYNVGTGIVMDVARQGRRFQSATVMLQAEVIERFIASPRTKAYGALTVQLGLYGEARAVFAVPPDAFVPPPKVTSNVAIVDIRPAPELDGLDPAWVERVVGAAFSQRRKTLRNALQALFGRERAEAACVSVGIDPGARAEVLDRAAFVKLASALRD